MFFLISFSVSFRVYVVFLKGKINKRKKNSTYSTKINTFKITPPPPPEADVNNFIRVVSDRSYSIGFSNMSRLARIRSVVWRE